VKAAVYINSSKVEVQEIPIPLLGPQDILLKVQVCGVCGTDVRKVQFGLIKKPTVLGHEIAGEVVEIGKQVTQFQLGDRVVVAHHTPCYSCHFCRHESYSMCKKFKTSNLDPGGFSEFVRIPADHVAMTAHRIPEDVPYDWAIHMEPMACVLRNVKRAHILPGDTVVVIGLGSTGLFTGQIVQNFGGQVIATDLREERRILGKKLGFKAVLDGSDPNFLSILQELTQGRGADVVILTAGTPKLYGEVVHWVRDGGKISLFAALDPKAQLTYNIEEIYHREITIYSSYSSSPAELTESLWFIQNRTLAVDILTPTLFPLSGLPLAIQSVVNQSVLKAIIQPQK
jgi:L-iditol 2-dehydrogenase